MSLSRRSLLTLAMALPGASALAELPAPWPRALVMGTGQPGGYYTVYGQEWGRLAQQSAGLQIAFRASGGAAANILLIEQNAAQLGMTTLTVAEDARSGTGAWTAGVKFREFRALFPIYPSVLQIVSPRSTGITTLAGLAGQIVGVGPDGGSGAAAAPAIFSSLGVLPRQVVHGDYNQQMRDMLDGKLSACAFIAAPPLPAIAHVAMSQRLSLIGFSEAEAKHVARTSPGVTKMVLQAGLFSGQSIAVASVGTMNFAIGAASLPNALTRALTLAALRNKAALAKVVPAAAGALQIRPILQGGIPFHPGAAEALRSFGVGVPAKSVEG